MSICEDRITEDSTEFEKEFLKIYDGNLWTALDKMKFKYVFVGVSKVLKEYFDTEEVPDGYVVMAIEVIE